MNYTESPWLLWCKLRIALGIACMLVDEGKAQIFSNVTLNSGASFISPFSNGGRGVTVYDINKDGWDDIIYPNKDGPIKILLNGGSGVFDTTVLIANTGDVKQAICGDYDNDGDADIFLTGYFSSCRLLRNEGNLTFSDVSQHAGILFTPEGQAFGAAWGDYNNDGWLDLFVSYRELDGNPNMLYRNMQDGTFSEVALISGIDDGNLLAVMPVFFDFNNDGLQDIYNMHDVGLGDALFMNLGNETFENISTQANISTYTFSMGIAACDFDNNGYEDIYISSFEQGNALYVNNGDGTFDDLASDYGLLVNSFCWGAAWLDVDNNREYDIYVANDLGDYTAGELPNQDKFYIQENGEFYEHAFVFPYEGYSTYGVATGDFNNDALPDIVISNGDTQSSQVYINTSDSNNQWAKLTLEGVVSNRDGVGSRIECWAGGQATHHQPKAGEAYLAQFSQHIILPLGQFNTIDSLIIHWLSGWKDTYYNLAAGEHYYLTEGGSVNSIPIVIQSDAPVLCPEQTLSIGVEGEWSSVLWNNGAEGETIDITLPGAYHAQVTSVEGLTFNTDTIQVALEEIPAIEINTQHPTCYGVANGSISVSYEPESISSIVWSNTLTQSTIENLSASTYQFQLQTATGCIVAGNVQLFWPEQLDVVVHHVPACYGSCTEVTAITTGGTGQTYIDWQGQNPSYMAAGSYSLTITDENNCVVEETFTIEEYEPIEVTVNTPLACYGMSVEAQTYIQGGSGIYIENWNGVDPHALFAGEYTLSVMDDAGCTGAATFTVSQSTEIVLEATVTNAYQGANGSIDVTVSGGYAPYTYLWSNGADTKDITELGQGTYVLYVTDAIGCSAMLTVDLLDLAVGEPRTHGSYSFPNPFTSHIELVANTTSDYQIASADGVLIQNGKLIPGKNRILLDHLAAGMYYLHYDGHNERIVKMP